MALQDSASTLIGMPIAEFIRLYEQEGPFELVDGERIPIVPGVAEHSEIIKLLYGLLLNYEREQSRARVYAETPYVLVYRSDWVSGARVPDLMAFDAARLAAYKAQDPDWKKKPFVLVPDLCVEVISPNDVYSEVDAKIERYLNDGVRLVWVVNPRTSSVQVYHAQSTQSSRLTVEHMLDGGDVLPGFALPIRALFTESGAD